MSQTQQKKERTCIRVGAEDWDMFLDAILRSPKPNKALKEAMAAHKRLTSGKARRKK